MDITRFMVRIPYWDSGRISAGAPESGSAPRVGRRGSSGGRSTGLGFTTQRGRGLTKLFIARGLRPLTWVMIDLGPSWGPTYSYLLNPLNPLGRNQSRI